MTDNAIRGLILLTRDEGFDKRANNFFIKTQSYSKKGYNNKLHKSEDLL